MPSGFVTGIAFEVAAASTSSISASASIVVTPGVATSLGASSRSGKTAARGIAACDLEIGSEVAVLAGDERVLTRARGREEVQGLLAAHHPGLGLDRRVLERRTRWNMR